MDLQPWSKELQQGQQGVYRSQSQNLGYSIAPGPANITTRGNGQFQSVEGSVGLAAGEANSQHFAAIVRDAQGQVKIQVKGDATVTLDRHHNIRAQVDDENFAEYNPKADNQTLSSKFKNLLKVFDSIICCR